MISTYILFYSLVCWFLGILFYAYRIYEKINELGKIKARKKLESEIIPMGLFIGLAPITYPFVICFYIWKFLTKFIIDLNKKFLFWIMKKKLKEINKMLQNEINKNGKR